jgi:secondary thiamine-phosphate synthase enzyme
MQEFLIKSDRQAQIFDITSRVAECVRQSAVADGICCVYTPHTTAAITINENDDPNICDDILEALAKLVPAGVWRHDRIDNNAAAQSRPRLSGRVRPFPCKMADYSSAGGRP